MGIGSMGGFEVFLAILIYLGIPALLIAGITWIVVRVARAARGTTAAENEVAALRERVARLELERDRVER